MVKRTPPHSIWCRSHGHQVFDFKDLSAFARRPDFQIAEVQPELPRGAWASAIATATALSLP
jgi:hypothetical protein